MTSISSAVFTIRTFPLNSLKEGRGESSPKVRTGKRFRKSIFFGKMFFLIGCFVIPHQSRALAFDDILIKEFQAKAPVAWDAYLSHNFIYRCNYAVIVQSGEDPPMHIKRICKEQKGCRLVETVSFGNDERTLISAYGSNPDYFFTVQKKINTKDWLLTNLIIGKPEEARITGDYSANIAKGIYSILLMVGPTSLPELIKESTFKVVDAKSTTHNNTPCVKIEFTNFHPLTTKGTSPIQSGWFVLDPNQCWCVRDYRVNTKHSNANSIYSIEKISIQSSRDQGFPLPEDIRATVTMVATEPGFEGTETIRKTTATYSIDETRPIPLNEFRLPGYNLPEPDEFNKSYFWFYIVGTILLGGIFALVFYLFGKAQLGSRGTD